MLNIEEIYIKIAYSMFFISIDIIVYNFLQYVMEFAEVRGKRNSIRNILRVVLLLDSISMLLNIKFEHAFGYNIMTMHNGEQILSYNAYSWYYVRLILLYIIMALVFFEIINVRTHSIGIYRLKYNMCLWVLGFLAIDYLTKFFFKFEVSFTCIWFSFAGIVFFIFSVQFASDEFQIRTTSMITSKMIEGIIQFDINNVCIFINESAYKLMEKGQLKIGKKANDISKWLKGDPKDVEEFTCRYTAKIKNKNRYLRVTYNRILDNKSNYLGCFFTLNDETDEYTKYKEIKYEATHDLLTGLYSKQYFEELVKKRLKDEPNEEFLMICSDINNFKLINDVFGEKVGDKILKGIANNLHRKVKTDALYCRVSGDKFAMLYRKKDYNENVFMKSFIHLDRINQSYPVKIYVGVYEIIDKNTSVSVMCDRAFMAINTIKGDYNSNIVYYNNELRSHQIYEQELIGELNTAILEKHIYIYLQPQFDSFNNVNGAEALVRWKHPTKGMIMPGFFIPAFEKNGLISKLDMYVWELACQKLQEWKKAGSDKCYISVNISPKDIYFIDVYKTITDLVEKYQINPKNLKLEITETAIANNFKDQMELITKLRDYGFVVEMDDFGSGYSSLNMLKDILVDVLKLDMRFLGETKDEYRSRAILRTIVSLSKMLNIKVIVEGVETKEQLEFLKEMGCNMFQGYYFEKPIEVSKYEEKYMAS